MVVRGNRGKCAQPCRLPYSLMSSNGCTLDKGYLLSTRDLCSLENLPELIKSGVSSFKIEGRMKSPTYVATVTRIYRKYIDLATKFNNNEIHKYIIDEQDKQDLIQVFNRGEFSSGHLLDKANKKLIYPQKPNNMGIYLGKISKYNKAKGLISTKLENKVSIGDGISLENETAKYTISELVKNNSNIKQAISKELVTFGRMKGNIKVGDKIYKITDKELYTNSINSFSKENRKTYLSCKLEIKANNKVKILVKSLDFGIEESFIFDYIPDLAKNTPISVASIKNQFYKTLNTCFEFSKLDILLDENLFIPVSILNEMRRQVISIIENKLISSFKRSSNITFKEKQVNKFSCNGELQQKSLLFNRLNTEFDYFKLNKADRIYIPLKYFLDNEYSKVINTLSEISKLYIYMPIVIKDKYFATIKKSVDKIIRKFNISGFVVSEFSSLSFLKDYNLDLIANYSFNIYNSYTADKLKKCGFSTITLSPELDLLNYSSVNNEEIIVYGKIPLMTMSYCLLGKSNMCYKECKHLCLSDENFYLNDRYNFDFRIIPDNLQTLTTIYNSRNISLSHINSNSIRFDILDETIEEINKILN